MRVVRTEFDSLTLNAEYCHAAKMESLQFQDPSLRVVYERCDRLNHFCEILYGSYLENHRIAAFSLVYTATRTPESYQINKYFSTFWHPC